MLPALISLLLAVPVTPVVIENAAVRLEVDPQLMSVRYVGPPDGPNLVDNLHVEARDRRLGDWLDAGGITWDVTPGEAHDASLRRGPATVLVSTASRVVLLSPVSEASPYRLKLEFTLPSEGPEIAVTSTLSSEDGESRQPVSVRCAFRVRPGALVGSYDARSAVVYPLDRPERKQGMPIASWDGVLFDAGAPGSAPLVATALGASAVIDRDGVKLIREVAGGTATPDAYARAVNLHAVSDPRTQTYGLVMESPRAKIDVAEPLVYREVWRLSIEE